MLLQEFQFKIEHVKGKENFSDMLSRAFHCGAVTINKISRRLVVPTIEDEETILKEYNEATGHGGLTTMKH